jgi:hypothetical protein
VVGLSWLSFVFDGDAGCQTVVCLLIVWCVILQVATLGFDVALICLDSGGAITST